ncbi:MAG: Xaa-Pro peptidase family protein [Spirochaetota bacterium]
MHNERIEKVRGVCELPLLVTDHHHIFYLTGFSGSAGRLLITRDGAFLFVDARYYEHAAATVPSAKAVLISGDYDVGIARFLSGNGVGKVSLDNGVSIRSGESFTEACTPGIAVAFVDDCIKQFREVKDNAERALIKENLLLAETAFTRTLAFVKEDMTEKELAAELDYRMRSEGGDASSFETIVLFGVRTSMPHGVPSDARLTRGDMVLIDFGMRRNGYCTDTTRTFFFGKGRSYAKLAKLYDAVREAQEAGIAAAATNARAADVDAAARSVLAAHKLGAYFGHGLGHGVGVEIHEAPTVSERGGIAALKGGSVVTIEPGVYIPGTGGIRIENMVIVTKNGGASINTTPADRIVL